MAYQTGTAYGHKDLLRKIRAMIAGAPLIDSVSFSGTGNGELQLLMPADSAPAETWTITCAADKTGQSVQSIALTNGDAETGDMTGWTSSGFSAETTSPQAGTYRFTGAGAASSYMEQVVDPVASGVSTTDIDAGSCLAYLTWYMRTGSGVDYGHAELIFLDSTSTVLATATSPDTSAITDTWQKMEFKYRLPANTRTIKIKLTADVGVAGDTAANVYYDSISIEVITNPEYFTVSGSTSGTQAELYTDSYYDNTLISCKLTTGTTDFVAGDAFTVTLTTNPLVALGETWTIQRWDQVSDEMELIAYGPGTSGSEQLFIGIKAYHSVTADYYNLKFNTFTGYVPGNDFDSQPGRKGSNYATPLWQFATPYHLMVNGNRIICLAKVETVYQSFYLGRFLPYGTPGQYPYPICMWGMLTSDSATRYSDTTNIMGCKRDAGTALRFVDGAYKNPRVWPYYEHQHDVNSNDVSGTQFSQQSLRDTEGDYPCIPCILYATTYGLFGEYDGVYYVPGFAQAVENTITIGADTYIVWRDHERTGFYDYLAVKEA